MNISSIRRIIKLLLLLYISFFYSLLYAEPLWVFFKKEPARDISDKLSAEYINDVACTGAYIRTVSRYFNAVSVDWDGDFRVLESLPGVESVRQVKTLKGIRRAPDEQVVQKESGSSIQTSHSLRYGVAYDQLNILNIPALHDHGYTGKGVCVGVLDTGFDFEETGCLREVHIAHTRNFVRGGEDVTGDVHGGYVLSCLAGALDGEYYGVAFGATFLLAVTDNIFTERRTDEDRWVAAVEWCDSLGADIISSSLVYNIFETQGESYSKDDMDGKTSLVAQAAEIAASHGIIVTNAAGNEGNNNWRIITTPGDSEHVIAVGSVTYTGESPVISSFSSRGPTADGRIKPDVVAPGSYVQVPQPGTSGQYISKSGTSFATPFISGLCALLIEAHPEWTPSVVMETLKQSATDLGSPGPDNDYGWGLPDAVRAMSYVVTDVAYDETIQNRMCRGTQSRSETFPLVFRLNPPFPNPFNSIVTIPFSIENEIHLTVNIHDITGRRITTVWDTYVSPGEHQVVWNGESEGSGMYLVRAFTSQNSTSRKIMLIK